MNHMLVPEKIYFMTQSVIPITCKINTDKRQAFQSLRKSLAQRLWYSDISQRNKDVFLWIQNQREETAIYKAGRIW